MTREEAADRLDSIAKCLNVIGVPPEELHLAIKALKEPKCVMCKDCHWSKRVDYDSVYGTDLVCQHPHKWVVATDEEFGCIWGTEEE